MTDTGEKKFKNLIKTIWIQIAINFLAMLGFAFYLGTLDHGVDSLEDGYNEMSADIEILKKEKVGSGDYLLKSKYYRIDYLWAERWGWDLPEQPFNERGGVPNL